MRTTRKELDQLMTILANRLGVAVGYEPGNIYLDSYKPGTARLYKVEQISDKGGSRDLFGSRRHTAGEMATCLRYALDVLDFVQLKK